MGKVRDDYFAVPRSHPGQTIFVLAGGPSLAGQPIKELAGRPIVAVNLSYGVAPDAVYVYAQDGRFLGRHRGQLERRFQGRVVTVSRRHVWAGLKICRKVLPSLGLPTRATDLAARRTSLAGGISIAAHMTGPGGAIVLLGADGGRGPDGRAHHHADHPWPVVEESWSAMQDDLLALKPGLEAAGITVTNCSPGSRWRDLWPIMGLADYLKTEGGNPMSVVDWKKVEAEKKRADYVRIFGGERGKEYPALDALESLLGRKIRRDILEDMAFSLACPLKANPPNWQHGRVLYALAHMRAGRGSSGDELFLDIGTAKGFSALCMALAVADAGGRQSVHSFDVIDPDARVERNSVAELEGLKTLHELTKAWQPHDVPIFFHKTPGMFFNQHIPRARIAGAFVDGKHKKTDVLAEALLIAARQDSGDWILFDDAQIAGVGEAVEAFKKTVGIVYLFQTIEVIPGKRSYVLAVRK